jgi:hypothetical protein
MTSPVLPNQKVCRHCGQIKLRTQFYRNKNMADGLFAECKACWCAKTRAYRADNDAVRERDRARRHRPDRKDALAAAVKDRAKREPEKVKARTAVAHALRAGSIQRQSCEVCGSDPAQAHHDDYTKPLEVRWLCARHHAQLHAAMKWTRIDDQWVQVPYELTRGPNGLSDRPARSPLALEVKPTQKEQGR